MKDVKVFYIAIKVGVEWIKNPNAKKAIKLLFNGKHINKVANYKGVRLLEVTLPLDDTIKDDLIFYEDGGYLAKGRTEVKKYDQEAILEFLQSKRGE